MAEYIERERIAMGVLGLAIVDPMVAQYADAVLLQIKQAPAADVAPVVRCKDCMHWLNEDGMNDHVCLKIYSDGAVSSYAWQDRNPDDFCSYGERKDGDGK